jgi:hypothetical protein
MGNWATFADSILKQTTATFGQDVTYTPAVGSPVTIQGIFDHAYQDVQLQHGPGVSSVRPVLGIRLADLAARPAKGDTATIGATIYRVIDIEEDGQGGATLRLQKQ